MAEIWAENHQSRLRINKENLIRLIKHILKALSFNDEVSLSVVITDEAGIQALNRQYLNRDRPTNVISFPMKEGESIPGDPTYLGDIVISADAAFKEGETFGYNVDEMLLLYVIHGILHLSGYNHEGTDEPEAHRMERKQQEIFEAFLPKLESFPIVLTPAS